MFVPTQIRFLSGLWFCLMCFLFLDPKVADYVYINCNELKGYNFSLKYMQ